MDWGVVLAAGAAAMVGNGILLGIAYLALVEKLRRTFATDEELAVVKEKLTDDVNGVGARLERTEKLHIHVRDQTDENRERTRELEIRQQAQTERIEKNIIRPLERITDRLDAVSQRVARIQGKTETDGGE